MTQLNVTIHPDVYLGQFQQREPAPPSAPDLELPARGLVMRRAEHHRSTGFQPSFQLFAHDPHTN
jgi:hypothetical protein